MQDGLTSDVVQAGLVVGGKFRLDALIGQGGMGSVWSATHLSLGNRVAIKLVSREFVRSPDALRRFDAEAKAAARLQSRHIVQVYDSGTLEDATPYIAMELLTGQTLQTRVETTGRVSLAETVAILAQCCKGLGRAHSLGIVHRDIKPENIFLSTSPDDEGYVVKILDFGVAKLTLGPEGDQGSTKTGTVLGTPLYMSPEQARGLRGVDHRTDIYSLGLVAYTMLTGWVAFNGESFGDILLKICTEPLPRIGATVSVPPAVEAWFDRVCARDPAQRCANTQEFIETLRAAVGDGVSRPLSSADASVSRPSGVGSATAPFLDSGLAAPSAHAVGHSVSTSNVSITKPGVSRAKAGALVAVAGVLTLLAGGGAAAFFITSRAGHTQSASSGVAAAPVSAPEVPGAASQATQAAAVTLEPVATAAPPPSASTAAPTPSASVAGPADVVAASPHGTKPPVPVAQNPVSKPATHNPPPTHPAPGPAKPITSPSRGTIDLGY
jgi:serine/threonine-protein kinase